MSKKNGAFWDDEKNTKKLKSIYDAASSFESLQSAIEKWRRAAAPKETTPNFWNKCRMKAYREEFVREEHRGKSWFLELSAERQKQFEKDWGDIAKYQNVSSLFAAYPEAGSVAALLNAKKRFLPDLPNRFKLQGDWQRAQKEQTPKPERTASPTAKNWWMHLAPERKKEFDERFRKDNASDKTSLELLQLWPEAINGEGLRFAALHVGETRNRSQIRLESLAEIKASQERERIKRLENAIRTIDEIAEKHGPIPRTDQKAPRVIRAKDGQESVKVIGSTFIGMVRPGSTFEHPLSNTLRETELRRLREKKPDAVIITGDIVYLDATRFSNLKPKRAVLEQIPVIPEVVTDEWVRRQIELGETIFLTFQEKLEMLLEVVREMFAPKGKPIYGGKIFVCLGKREEDIATYIANERANAEVAVIRAGFTLELGRLRMEWRKAKKIAETTQITRDIARVDTLAEGIKTIERRLRERLKATSLSSGYLRKLLEKSLCYIAARLEQTIPNSEVISAGDAFIKVGEELIEVRQKGTESPTDSFESKMIGEFSTRATAGERVPDLTIGGGLNPVWTRGEIDQARGDFSKPNMTAPFIITAPTCMPAEYLRDIIKEIHGATTAGGQSKLIRSRDFTGGTFDMNWVDGFPMVRYWTDACLTNRELWSSAKAMRDLMEGQYMIYELVSGCEHRGQNWAAFMKGPRGPLMFTETVWEFLLEHDVPLHMVHWLGDKWTGHNFPGKSYQKPEEWMTPDQVRNFIKVLDLWAKDKPRAIEILSSQGRALEFMIEEIQRVNPCSIEQKYQFFQNKIRQNEILAGMDGLDLQRDSWKREVLPLEAELVARALKRARKAGVTTLGHNIGLCVCETGNHVTNTEHKSIGLHFSEGHEIEIYLEDAIRMTHPELWENGRLAREVVAPVVGRYTKAEGLFGHIPPKEAEKLSAEEREALLAYRLAAKHKGAQGGSKYTDLIRVIRNEDAKRGRRRAHGEKFSVSHFGHSHYCFSTFARNRYLTVGGCHTFDDPYGEEGNYRLTSVCSTIHGFPARGPAWGPITEVHLRFAEFKDYVQKPWPVDIAKLFPNALV